MAYHLNFCNYTKYVIVGMLSVTGTSYEKGRFLLLSQILTQAGLHLSKHSEMIEFRLKGSPSGQKTGL